MGIRSSTGFELARPRKSALVRITGKTCQRMGRLVVAAADRAVCSRRGSGLSTENTEVWNVELLGPQAGRWLSGNHGFQPPLRNKGSGYLNDFTMRALTLRSLYGTIAALPHARFRGRSRRLVMTRAEAAFSPSAPGFYVLRSDVSNGARRSRGIEAMPRQVSRREPMDEVLCAIDTSLN